MRKATVQAFTQAVETRKREAGISESAIAAARNTGQRRTPAKREQLAGIQKRARAAGLEPLPAMFKPPENS